MSTSYEARVIRALEQMDAADFGGDEIVDLSAAARQVKAAGDRARADLEGLEACLTRVADLLRQHADTVVDDARAAREAIAGHFAAGALATRQAHAALQAATEDLEYPHYPTL